ncbi:MAG TPA: hypothetical protein VMC79_15870 [Rectinemataceae bacterium]|nr:hypothetical protein [Rectinemataceae bacterium]
MGRKAASGIVGLLFLLFVADPGIGQDVFSFGRLSASSHPAANGGTELVFEAVLNLNVVPIAFNFHWERSDGAHSQVKVVNVSNAAARTYTMVERWTVGPGASTAGLWERIFVNSGNTHLSSGPIQVAEGSAPAAVASQPAPAVQQPAPGAHPAYLHALSDLRMARALLSGWSNPLIMRQLQNAVQEIEGALGDITRAAISDGKNIDDHPPVDTTLDNRNRLTRALELLNTAYKDIDERETNPADAALRSTALGHISRARQDLNDARKIMSWL